jgi:hypothetical protein
MGDREGNGSRIKLRWILGCWFVRMRGRWYGVRIVLCQIFEVNGLEPSCAAALLGIYSYDFHVT